MFCSRGTQEYVTRVGSYAANACFTNASMSGCLTFQRPDICSTMSLESSRTSISAAGSSSAAAVSPAISPRYSATLLLATPIASERSASTSPVSGSRTIAP